MAFVKGTTVAASTDQSWKAQAFCNFYIRRPDGSRVKFGAIALKDSKRFEAALIERLKQEGAVEDLMKVLEIDFQLAESSEPAQVGF